MPFRMTRVHHAFVLGLLLLAALALQGCLAMVWLGAVGVDMSRTSEIEFQPFENTWEW
jgi:membrane protein implicated in regulation of membrane protease activity